MWMDKSAAPPTMLDPRFQIVGVGTGAGTFQGYGDARVFTADFGG